MIISISWYWFQSIVGTLFGAGRFFCWENIRRGDIGTVERLDPPNNKNNVFLRYSKWSLNWNQMNDKVLILWSILRSSRFEVTVNGSYSWHDYPVLLKIIQVRATLQGNKYEKTPLIKGACCIAIYFYTYTCFCGLVRCSEGTNCSFSVRPHGNINPKSLATLAKVVKV